MDATTRVLLHCHSIFSDGAETPELLAERIAAAGVRYAALTDHDSVEGLARFRVALERRGVGFISGVELTVQSPYGEAHLLGFGFDPNHAELLETLRSLRQARAHDAGGIADSLYRIGSAQTTSPAAPSAAPDGKLSVEDAIALLHRAGGRAFLAHPLSLPLDAAELEVWVARLRDQGLDGIEALYEPYAPAVQAQLCALADRLELCVSAGTDTHGAGACGVDLPTPVWRRFRDLLFAAPQAADLPGEEPLTPPPPSSSWISGRGRALAGWAFFMRIVFPTLLAIAMFVAGIWLVVLPTFERALLDRKREMIRELTNSAWSVLAECERKERDGALSRDEAQALAASRIESLRYGKEGKDYFWLHDMQPRIVMHPYRKDLNGQDVSDFVDSDGTRIFVEFADLVRRKGEGYIQYVWQWMDNPDRIEPKESYVKGFQPWGWVIGTGLYIEDLQAETAAVERGLLQTSLLFSAVVALLLLFVVQQSRRIERDRQAAETALRESHERYRSLVEATTEGTLLALEGRCSYANPTLLQMLGYARRQLALLDVEDLLPRTGRNQVAWEAMDRSREGAPDAGGFDCVLRKADGGWLEALVMVNAITIANRPGSILLIRESAAAPGERGGQAGRDLQADRDAALDNLQTSLLFLHEPVGPFSRRVVRCGLETPVHRVAALMTAQHSSAALVEAESGAVVGIVTDSDLRARALACDLELRAPVRAVMSAPLVGVTESTPIYEALLRLEERGVGHLAVLDELGNVTGVVRNRDLLRFHHYGASVLAREIVRSRTPEEVVRHCHRVAGLAGTLVDFGARPRNVTRMITSVCDAATQRFIALAEEELGPPPVEYAFIALGSQGRMEQTLASDQDNAIIYLPAGDEASAALVGEYFERLGERVCAWLDRAGYPLCKGNTMAGTARWRRTLEDWKACFTDWVRRAEPQQLLEFSIFFDFRTVCGAPEPARELRRHVHLLLRDAPAFFPHFAQHALEFKPPYWLFGKILVSGGSAERGGQLNLKDAMMPIVSFARLYALRHELEETHSLDRMDALAGKGFFTESSHEELVAAYEFLMRLRLRHQLQMLQNGLPPDNSLQLRTLGHTEETLLKESFAQIAAVQKKISYDFLGGS